MSDETPEEPRDIPFDPVAFAEKWFEDHPEVLDGYNQKQSQSEKGIRNRQT